MLKLNNGFFARNGLVVAKEFNQNVLKGQLNPNGSTVETLAEMIDNSQTALRWFQQGFSRDETIATLEATVVAQQEEIQKLKISKSAVV